MESCTFFKTTFDIVLTKGQRVHNHLVYIIMDSCRYDSVMAASTPNMDRIGVAERRYSYASWTSPSHYAYLMGMTPHVSPAGVFASEVYKK
jgi:hypothetical protein